MILRLISVLILLIVLNPGYIQAQTNSTLSIDDLKIIDAKLHNYNILSNQNRLLHIKNGLCLSNLIIYTQVIHIKDRVIHKRDKQIILHKGINIALAILLIVSIL